MRNRALRTSAFLGTFLLSGVSLAQTLTGPSSNSMTSMSQTINNNLHLMAQVDWNPGSISGNSCATTTLDLLGARPTLDAVSVAPPPSIAANLILTGRVSAAGVIEFRLCNPTTSPISQGDGTWTVVVIGG
jgi:hypothetical protein